MEHFDVLIVGAGISGIGAARHLARQHPGKSYAIFEGRSALGGTWDLFRYPGIRSDSDMYTLGFAFRPWREAKAIADGPSILKYLRETARDTGVDRHIRYEHKVKRASWDSSRARWTVEVERGPDKTPAKVTCGFLFMCTGYYNYARGHRPEFPNEQAFQGPIVHPQFWPENFDYSGKRVVVIGSGATAVTLVPAMTDKAAHVTMLQRSPTYVVSRPAEDTFANWLRKVLPAQMAYDIIRWRNVVLQAIFFNLARTRPEKTKERLLGLLKQHLSDAQIAEHFTPAYNPWDQRLCLVPDADLFKAIGSGKASVVTDHIARFTPNGIELKSGKVLEADVIVTATGLDLQVLSGLEADVDGVPVDYAKTFSYKGIMYSGVPNMASVFGYTNASWTLKADLTAEYVCRLLAHMDARGFAECRPVAADPNMKATPWLDFSSGYVVRAMEKFPKQGDHDPWLVHQNYWRDLMAFRFGAIDDGVMRFTPRGARAPAAPPPQERPIAAE
ncbi:MAG: NAD(P)/FAD-dependent oxidoreductase [Alphaproteobacteria bacterium]|nr:NAD(P)/FAD-dependent oxidoreductase [Alphaproteobacteria bacterium]